MAILPDASPYGVRTGTGFVRCKYTATGLDGKFDLQLLSQCGSMYNCLSKAVSGKYSQQTMGTVFKNNHARISVAAFIS